MMSVIENQVSSLTAAISEGMRRGRKLKLTAKQISGISIDTKMAVPIMVKLIV